MSSDSEEWRSFGSGAYEVSSLGRIRRASDSPNASSGTVLKPFVAGKGYHAVNLYPEGGRRWRDYVHRIVARAFLGPCPEGMEVNHKNGVKTDNRVENLEWVTPTENVRHASENGLLRPVVGEKVGTAKLCAEDVCEIRRRYESGETQVSIAEDYPVGSQMVSRIVRRESWAHIE